MATLSSKLATALRDTAHAAWNSTEKDDLITWAVADIYPRFARVIDPATTLVDIVDDTLYYAVPSGVVEISRLDWFDLGAVLANPSAAADDIIDTTTKHGFNAGDAVRFTSLTGGSGLSVNTTYYVIATNLGNTTFQVSTTAGGSAVNFTTDITAGTVELVETEEHGSPLGNVWGLEGDPWGTLKLRLAPAIVEQGGTLRVHGIGRYDTSTNLIPDHLVLLVLAKARAEAYRRIAGDRARFEQHMVARQKQGVTINEFVTLVSEAEVEIDRLERSLLRTWRQPVPGRR